MLPVILFGRGEGIFFNSSSFDVQVTLAMGLSLFSQYHIRQLLHLYRDRLRLVAAPGRDLAASEHADLNAVVEGLYLEEAEIEQVFQQLNLLARMHASVSGRFSTSSVSHKTGFQRELEIQILRLLGLELMPQPVMA